MNNYTDITIVLDRSGSMNSIKTDTLGGLNSFINDQKNVEGKCTLTLIQFDSLNPQEIVRDSVNIKNIENLTEKDFTPRGNTPLYDALGYAIINTGKRLSNKTESERPKHVVFVIVTDGYENASHQYTQKQVFDMIKHQTDVYKWNFIYLGANQDAMAVGSSLGFLRGQTMTYGTTNSEIGATYLAASSNITNLRKSGITVSLNFSDEQRKKSKVK